ncbi:DUF2878 domain-containing protein [Aestuariibacter sp. A3R04]|uniref:DUF2878 domain-containing protein n=1 Tax=Aestuariibacter sp. A3R04 TaxID=2841571 RepID=UPI001C088649|nr:DUF2878 domain-containing protein [Aestuariibacter sp. A3R04]
MNKRPLNKVINFIWFQVIWFLVIFHQYTYLWVVALLIMAHFMVSPYGRNDICFALAIGLYGSVVDGLLTHFGIFVFPTSDLWFIPMWLVALWIAFGIMLRVSLDYLHHRFALSAFLGAVSGPLSYWAGARFGAVTFPLSLAATLTVVSAVWAITVPLWMWLNNRFVSLLRQQGLSSREESK